MTPIQYVLAVDGIEADIDSNLSKNTPLLLFSFVVVVTLAFFVDVVVFPSNFAVPKSAIFTLQFDVTNRFCGFRSRWMCGGSNECKYFIPAAASMQNDNFREIGKSEPGSRDLNTDINDPIGRYSVTMNGTSSSSVPVRSISFWLGSDASYCVTTSNEEC